MLKVFKYSVLFDDYFIIDLPLRAKILNVDMQGSKLVLWALVNPEFPTKERRFRLAGTGHLIEEDTTQLEYINSFKMQGGTFIFHVFEISY